MLTKLSKTDFQHCFEENGTRIRSTYPELLHHFSFIPVHSHPADQAMEALKDSMRDFLEANCADNDLYRRLIRKLSPLLHEVHRDQHDIDGHKTIAHIMRSAIILDQGIGMDTQYANYARAHDLCEHIEDHTHEWKTDAHSSGSQFYEKLRKHMHC